MVLINDQKFACQSCIKGHRSSSCEHTDRPLFEIRKKGRPVTQCDDCRDLRRTKKLHVRCACPGRKDPEADIGPVQIQSSSTTSRKAGRKIPIIPTLPSGLKDYQEKSPQSPTLSESTSRLAGTPVPDDSILPRSPTSSMVPTPTSRPMRPCCARKAAASLSESTTGSSSTTLALESTPDEEMACLCGPSCLCNGCTKHRPYGDAHGSGIGCPPDCPSCSNNEDGFVWPSPSLHPSSDRLASRSSVEPQPGSSDARGYSGMPDPFFESGFDMDIDYDDELDAEGSPDPAYIALPESSTDEASKLPFPLSSLQREPISKSSLEERPHLIDNVFSSSDERYQDPTL